MSLRLAIFGQAAFGKDVTLRLSAAGHEIVGVYVPPDKGRPDPLAVEAEARGWRLLRHPRFRRKGHAIPELVDEYRTLDAELNILPFTTVILPPEIVDGAPRGSLCFHPSLLPAYRGGAALAWQIILGASETGVTVFKPDAGVDTGPILIQRGGVAIDEGDSVSSLYFDKLYPLGVEAMVEAVAAVASGRAEFRPQSEEGASFQGLVDDEVARIDWKRPARELDRLIRGCDPQPGAWAEVGDPSDSDSKAIVRLYDCRWHAAEVEEAPGVVIGVADGRLQIAADGGVLAIGKLRIAGGAKQAAPECGLAPGVRLG